MPELPEVETMRRGILEIEGSIVVATERTACSKRPISITPRIDRLNKRVKGQKVLRVDRLGKRVVVVLENLDRLIFEPRMTGLVLIADPPTKEHLRFRLSLKKCPVKEVLFWDRRGLGNVCLLSDKEYQEKLTSGKLGPDALAITSTEFAETFRKKQREIKVALLDQAAVAGVGNCMPVKFSIWRPYTRKRAAIVCRKNSMSAFTSAWSRCWRWRLNTRGLRCPTERTATRLMIPAAIRTSTECMIGLEKNVPRVRSNRSNASFNANAQPSSARIARRNGSRLRAMSVEGHGAPDGLLRSASILSCLSCGVHLCDGAGDAACSWDRR